MWFGPPLRWYGLGSGFKNLFECSSPLGDRTKYATTSVMCYYEDIRYDVTCEEDLSSLYCNCIHCLYYRQVSKWCYLTWIVSLRMWPTTGWSEGHSRQSMYPSGWLSQLGSSLPHRQGVLPYVTAPVSNWVHLSFHMSHSFIMLQLGTEWTGDR